MSAFVGTLQIRTFDTSAACADINIVRQYVYNRMFIRVNDKTQEKKTAQQRRFIFPPSTTCCSTQHHQPMKSRHFYFYPIIVVLCHLS